MKRIFAFLFFIVAASCIDPYVPNLKNYKSLLVVEGVITNENNSYKIKLCRTTNKENSDPEKITDATVDITDGDGRKTDLQNCGNGYYKTDSTSFTGIIGQKYSLGIYTSEGTEYKSDECTMLPVAAIDKLYYEKGEDMSGVRGEAVTGLKISLNSADATGFNQYFRWTFEETWKFLLPNPKRYNCLMVLNPDTYLFEEVPVVNDICWKKSQSQTILTSSILSGTTNYINGEQVQFIDPVKSDRLTQEYSILVKQYSISEKEYDFWNNLKKVSEAGGDIFDSQPYQVISNVHNVSDVGEMVLGYFGVSSVSQKRIFINSDELYPLDLPNFKTDCAEIPKSPEDWPVPPPPIGQPPTFYEIYYNIMNTGEYTFIRPIFNTNKTLQKLVYAKKICSVCEVSGFPTKPDFWIDQK